MGEGIIIKFDLEEGHGWIEEKKTKKEFYFHYNFIKPSDIKENIKIGTKVKFSHQETKNGLEAFDIEI